MYPEERSLAEITKREEREVKKIGEDMFWKKVLKSILVIARAINTLRLKHMWEQGMCIHFSQALFFSLYSVSHIKIFNIPLLLQGDNRELNFQDLNIVLVFLCRSDRNSFPPPLCLIRERDSIITHINVTQKHLGICEAKKYKNPSKGSLMSSQIFGFAKASARKKDLHYK